MKLFFRLLFSFILLLVLLLLLFISNTPKDYIHEYTPPNYHSINSQSQILSNNQQNIDNNILTHQQQSDLIQQSKNYTFTATGFKYCFILNNASFDGSVYIHSLGGSIAQLNPDKSVFLNIIDSRALQIYKSLYIQRFNGNSNDFKRYACYAAAVGNYHFSNITNEKLLVSLDPIEYFKFNLPAIQIKIDISTKKPKFKLAYVIMVHEISGFINLDKLLKVLDDGNAIILIHVDANSRSNALQELIRQWILKRSTSEIGGNVHLAKFRSKNIWGHSSLVFTQLSAFWELLELADWDYVINLSNYDWPLFRNQEIHSVLTQDKYNGKNFIEWWHENSHLTERLYRPHLSQYDFSSIFHIEDLGVVDTPYPRWKMVKHHQWMIITPEFARFLKQDKDALEYLAFMEHSYIPDEIYFASVLLNSRLKNTLINCNKRYLRFSVRAAHPTWLGWSDRFVFPPGQADPMFFFIRKLNVADNVFGEQKLLKWIEAEHYNSSQVDKCNMDYVSTRIDCFKKYAQEIAPDNHLILVPVSKAFIVTAANLGCSLKHYNSTNIVFWSLDVSVHAALISIGRLSIYYPGFPSTPEIMLPLQAGDDSKFVRQYKPRVLKMILDAGFNVTLMDADSFLLSNFVVELREIQKLKTPDILIGTTFKSGSFSELEMTSSFMHFENTPSTHLFLEEMIRLVMQQPNETTEKIILRILKSHKDSEIIVPEDYNFSLPVENIFEDIKKGQTLSLQEHKKSLLTSKSQGGNSSLVLTLLDPKKFIDGSLFFSKVGNIDTERVQVLHTTWLPEEKITLNEWGLWLIDDQGNCINEYDPENWRKNYKKKN